APGARDDVGQHEHGHVAADAIALARDALEHREHCLAKPRVAVVDLERVGPAREIRVAPVGEDEGPAIGDDAAVVLRLARQVVVAAAHVVLRMLAGPGGIEGGGGWAEKQDEPGGGGGRPAY